MMSLLQQQQNQIDLGFYDFINNQVLPHTEISPTNFWYDFNSLISDLTPQNVNLLSIRKNMQQQINQWHRNNPANDPTEYEAFLREIGYLQPEVEDFCIETENVDAEIATMAGPQLVVPVQNARFALNAANARWGSLYDAYYGTDAIAPLSTESGFDAQRGASVIDAAKTFLDEAFPLNNGSHKDVSSYLVYFQHLLAFFPDGSESGLRSPCQFVAFDGSKHEPKYLLLKNNDLHVGITIDKYGKIGANDIANIDDIEVESALTTIVDFEDSIAAVDAEDKVDAYKNWLGLINGDLSATFKKQDQLITRNMNPDRSYTDKSGCPYNVHGRSLLLVRNVGHLMGTELIKDSAGNNAPEGIVDAVVTSLIASIDLQKTSGLRNSRTGSIYIVKPKMHGPDEVAFTNLLFERVEQMLNLPQNTIKMGIMDEERRTTLNLKACIKAAKSRVVFINTGFLDRTGDEIHTSNEAGPFYPKAQIKQQPWIQAYEDNNVQVGLRCGFSGRAQIGKGMWAMPDEMQQMMQQKIAHPQSGANTAWVPSPTAATLHALHYHSVDVFKQQKVIQQQPAAKLRDLLRMPVMPASMVLTEDQIISELENNIQGILGYVVRWVELGVGCSKVPDISNTGLMEDRATLRISSQHIYNWLHHNICNAQQVEQVLQNMASIVDTQNQGVAGYQNMMPNFSNNMAFKAARDLIFKGAQQPNGYTEPLLHEYRLFAKNH